MQTNDYEKLAQHIAAALAGEALRLDAGELPPSVPAGVTDAQRLVGAVSRPIGAAPQNEVPAAVAARPSAAGRVVSVLTRTTGLGPLATGLMSLFGGRRSEPAAAPLTWYEPPAAVALEAGLDARREFTGLAGYSAVGAPRAASTPAAPAAPVIQINVQAMDSRSFLDHSDDIARAVKEAMLHSHALNDVVTEI